MFGPGDGVIRVGDSSSHGGTVVTGQANYLVDGIPVAVVGDMVACPQKGHGVCPIVEGHPTFSANGKAVAFHGCSTACGATLFSSTAHYHAIGSPDAPAYADTPQPQTHQYQQRASSTELVSGSGQASTFQQPEVVNMSTDRWESIVNNTPAVFEIHENANADGGEPLHEIDFYDEVDDNEQLYEDAGREFGVDPDLLKTIAYLETTHGWYDRLNPWNGSYRPMNIKYDYWEPLGRELNLTREEVEQSPNANIRMAALLISRIQDRIAEPNIQKIASIYYFIGSEQVKDYGARARRIYDLRLWENPKNE